MWDWNDWPFVPSVGTDTTEDDAGLESIKCNRPESAQQLQYEPHCLLIMDSQNLQSRYPESE